MCFWFFLMLSLSKHDTARHLSRLVLSLSKDESLSNVGRCYAPSHFGSRFSRKASMPSAASRASMFSVITSAVWR